MSEHDRSPRIAAPDKISAPRARDTAAVFAALANETRLEAIRLLWRYPQFTLTAGDIARLLAVPHNTLSTHLSALQAAGLIRARRDGRCMLFGVIPDNFDQATRFLTEGNATAHFGTERVAGDVTKLFGAEQTVGRLPNILMVCTGNSARSIMAEAILNREAAGRVNCHSAGSRPIGKVNAYAVELLDALGYSTERLRSKSWTEFSEPDAPVMDLVITLCDRAAGEVCPELFGQPTTVHWGIADPTLAGETDSDQRAAFRLAYRQLMNRMTCLANLLASRVDASHLAGAFADIGRMEGATEMARGAASLD